MDGNYIKLNRSIFEWEWYHNINTCRLFLHMLLKANWRDGKFEGKTIPRGSFVSSIPKLSLETDLSAREVRTALEHLKKTGELTVKSYNKYSVFTINNYCLHQASDTQNDSQVTDKRQSNDIQTTTIEEKKEGKKERKSVSTKFVPPTQQDVAEFCKEKGYSNVDVERFVDFYKSKDWMVGKNKMKDWRAAVRNWNRSQRQELTTKGEKKNSFNNFDQREHNYDALEKQLLTKSKGSR